MNPTFEQVQPLLKTLFDARGFCRPAEQIEAALAAVLAVIPSQLLGELQLAHWKENKDPGRTQRAFEAFYKAADKAAKPKRLKSIIRTKDDKNVRRLLRDNRYTITKDGRKVIGPTGKELSFRWGRIYEAGSNRPGAAEPWVRIAGKDVRVFSLLVEVGFEESEGQKRARYFASLKRPPVVNDKAEAAAEDPEVNVPKGFDGWEEARAEDPETFEAVE